jgi:hypothetical protein
MTKPPPIPAEITKAKQQGAGCLVLVGIIAVLIIGNVFGDGSSSDSSTSAQSPTPEHMLAGIHGNTSTEAEFGRLLDTLQRGSAICDPEPDRGHAADVIYASWKSSGQTDSLLDWARALVSVCQ